MEGNSQAINSSPLCFQATVCPKGSIKNIHLSFPLPTTATKQMEKKEEKPTVCHRKKQWFHQRRIYWTEYAEMILESSLAPHNRGKKKNTLQQSWPVQLDEIQIWQSASSWACEQDPLDKHPRGFSVLLGAPQPLNQHPSCSEGQYLMLQRKLRKNKPIQKLKEEKEEKEVCSFFLPVFTFRSTSQNREKK